MLELLTMTLFAFVALALVAIAGLWGYRRVGRPMPGWLKKQIGGVGL